ncbi:retinaldehyde-binding protein 1 [Folsomia candida]|uniref:Alpha-tocopherol transfer protein n=1 Tax=Folsomia candida TaxID=158441 RepID=A0A226ENU6_FOLCA|nr:retinaldehyde-binding protein 1 [Folsomia candida]OXA58246.1 Alpha-tocopherol transfer protein [Folsomia candida]
MTLDYISDENLEKTLSKFGDQSDEYTDDENRAIQEYFELFDNDEETLPFRKYATKGLVIPGLRSCNLDAKLAFKSMKALHYHATKTYPELFAQLDPLKLKPIIEKKLFQVVKRPVDKGPAIVVFRIRNWKPSEANIEHLALTGALYIYAVAKMSAEIQRQGIIVVSDVSGFKLAHARQASVDLIMMSLRLYTTMPPMIKGMVAINSLRLFEASFNMFKWILPEDIRKIMHITRNDMSHMTKLMAPDRLPVEFGGTIPDEEAYMDQIEDEILKDPELFILIKHVQDEFMATNGIKRKHSNKFNKI